MVKKKQWLTLAIIVFFTLVLSVYISYKTGKTEYEWIIGSMLFGIGCGSKYHNEKKK